MSQHMFFQKSLAKLNKNVYVNKLGTLYLSLTLQKSTE